MRQPVHFLPILTTLISIAFTVVLWRRYRDRRSGPHLLWWAFGVFMYGVGTFTESWVTLFGWSEGAFRAWYISGALLGGAPLAQGTVYLLLKRSTANRLTALLVPFILVAATCVLLTPLDHSLVETHRLSGQVMEWQWVRRFSPFVNLYAVFFLVGGAFYSAYRFRGDPNMKHRVIGNVLIAVGAILPGIGGAATRMGHVEVLYVGELVGLLLIWAGYRFNVTGGSRPAPDPAEVSAVGG